MLRKKESARPGESERKSNGVCPRFIAENFIKFLLTNGIEADIIIVQRKTAIIRGAPLP